MNERENNWEGWGKVTFSQKEKEVKKKREGSINEWEKEVQRKKKNRKKRKRESEVIHLSSRFNLFIFIS